MLRLIALLLLLNIFTQTSHAQTKDRENIPSSKPSKKDPLMDDIKFSIDEYVKGSIISLSDSTQQGVLRFNGNVVIFEGKGPKFMRYSAKEIKGFYTSTDTFKVYTDTTVIPKNPREVSFGPKLFIESQFISQVIYGHNVCLYKVLVAKGAPMTMSGAGGMTVGRGSIVNSFFFKRRNEIQYTPIPDNKKAFKKLLAVYLKDDSELVKAINEDRLKYTDLEEIVNRYNNKS